MKKFLLMGVLVSMVFAARYPISLEYYYMDGCVKGSKHAIEKQIAYCACTLRGIEKRYTLNQFVTNMQTNKKAFLQKLAKTAIAKCIDKLIK